MATSSCFHVTQVEEIKRIVGEGLSEREIVGPDGSPVSGGSVRIQNPSGLRRWRAAFADAVAGYGIARINCLGDSITLGARSNDSDAIPTDDIADANGYVGRLRALLAAQCSASPAGYIAANDKRCTISGTGSVTSSIGPLIHTVRTTNTTSLGGTLPLPSGATISFPVPRATTIEILYCDSNTNTAAGAVGANTGTFSYAVDGGGATTTTADNVNPISYKRITVSGLSDATHTLLLTGVSGTCYIAGIRYYGASGVVVSRLGLSGGTSLDLTGEGVISHLSAGSIQRISGAIGPSASPVLITGSITAGSPVVTGISSTAGIVAGMPVGASSQLPLPCFVQSVDSGSQITLSAAATGTNAARTMYIGAGVTWSADLWIIPIGHNDWQQQGSAWPTTIGVFVEKLRSIADLVANAGGCVLFVGEPDSNTPAPAGEVYLDSEYRDALAQVVEGKTHAACIKITDSWGDFDAALGLGLLSVAGGVHPIKRGSADMARLLHGALNMPMSS